MHCIWLNHCQQFPLKWMNNKLFIFFTVISYPDQHISKRKWYVICVKFLLTWSIPAPLETGETLTWTEEKTTCRTSYFQVPPKISGQIFNHYSLRNKKDIHLTDKLTVQLCKTMVNPSCQVHFWIFYLKQSSQSIITELLVAHVQNSFNLKPVHKNTLFLQSLRSRFRTEWRLLVGALTFPGEGMQAQIWSRDGRRNEETLRQTAPCLGFRSPWEKVMESRTPGQHWLSERQQKWERIQSCKIRRDLEEISILHHWSCWIKSRD